MIEEEEVDASELVPAQSRARKKSRKEKIIHANTVITNGISINP